MFAILGCQGVAQGRIFDVSAYKIMVLATNLISIECFTFASQ